MPLHVLNLAPLNLVSLKHGTRVLKYILCVQISVLKHGTRVLVRGDRCEVSDMIFLNPSFLMAICTFVRVWRGPLYSKGLWWVQFGGFDDAM